MTKEHKILQLFYAGVLADSVRNYENAGILESVTEGKLLQQQRAAALQLKQLEIDSVESLFNNFSRIFGCIDWKVDSQEEEYRATGEKCLLCIIAKSMGTAQPCSIYCINPFKSFASVIGQGYKLSVKETLWNGSKCEFLVKKMVNQ